MADIFLSYASHDRERAGRLEAWRFANMDGVSGGTGILWWVRIRLDNRARAQRGSLCHGFVVRASIELHVGTQ